MKLRNFKKAIKRAGKYKYHTPRIQNSMLVKDDDTFVYYTCHKLNARVCTVTDELFYIIRRK